MQSHHFVLVPGHWLGGWAWARVTAELEAAGHQVTAVTLPGLEADHPDRGAVRLRDQITALAAVVRRVGPGAILVAHSGSGRVATGVLDLDPKLVGRVVYVDSGPAGPGPSPEPAPEGVDEVELPPFDELGKQASLDGISADDLAQFRGRAVPHPAQVTRDDLDLVNDLRRDVPTTLVCCSLSGDDVGRLATQGIPMFAEVALLTDLTTIDLPTGHWPMFSRPYALAHVLVEAVDGHRSSSANRPPEHD